MRVIKIHGKPIEVSKSEANWINKFWEIKGIERQTKYEAWLIEYPQNAGTIKRRITVGEALGMTIPNAYGEKA